MFVTFRTNHGEIAVNADHITQVSEFSSERTRLHLRRNGEDEVVLVNMSMAAAVAFINEAHGWKENSQL